VHAACPACIARAPKTRSVSSCFCFVELKRLAAMERMKRLRPLFIPLTAFLICKL